MANWRYPMPRSISRPLRVVIQQYIDLVNAINEIQEKAVIAVNAGENVTASILDNTLTIDASPSGAISLDELEDVDSPNPAYNQSLVWTGSQWQPVTRLALPAGGAAAQVLEKDSEADGDASWSNRYPPGGAQNYVLQKNSSTDDDVSWGPVTAL